MVPKPKRRCGTCRWYTPGDEPGRGWCTNVAIAQNSERVAVHEGIVSCAGQYFGNRDMYEPAKRSWWPFGAR